MTDAGRVGMPAGFINRVDELRVLQQMLDDVVSGRPSTVVITGKAGIGKTWLVEELLRRAREVGARTLAATCHEDLRVPYLPLAAALQPLEADARADDALPESSADWVTLGEDRRLTQFLRSGQMLLRAARERPVVISVSDLHWIDPSTADLLAHVATSVLHEATAERLPVLLIQTTRPERPEAARRVLRAVEHHPATVRLQLEPFGTPEVHALVASRVGGSPTTELVEVLLDATGGLPLLLDSVITRHLAGGTLVERDGTVTLDPTRAELLVVPADFGDEVRIRLEGLKESDVELVTVAAVLGDGCRLADLAATVGRGVEVGDLRATQLVEIMGERCHFVHPEIRHALYHRLDPGARAAVHLRAAEVLRRGDESDDRVVFGVVDHFRRAGSLADPVSVLDWCERAGARAIEVGAWPQAASSYQAAVWQLDQVEVDDHRRLELLLRWGVAGYHTLEAGIDQTLRRAADLARRLGDLERWAEAVMTLARLPLSSGPGQLGRRNDTSELTDILEQVGDDELRGRILTTLVEIRVLALDEDGALRYAAEAEKRLAGSSNRRAVARLELSVGLIDMARLRLGEATARFRRAADAARSLDEHGYSASLAREGLVALVTGDRDRSRRLLESARSIDRRNGFWGEHQVPSSVLASLATAQGDFETADGMVAEASSLYGMDAYAFTPGMLHPVAARLRLLRGDVEGAHQVVDDWEATGARGTWRYRALIEAFTGGADAVRAGLAERPWRSPEQVDVYTLDIPCLHVAVGRVLDDPEMVDGAVSTLQDALDAGVVFTPGWPWFLPRLMGDAWATLGEADEAMLRYEAARQRAERIGAQLEVGLTHLAIARLHHATGEHEDSDHAKEAARRLDALGALVPAREARRLLADRGRPVPPPQLRAVMVTDLGGSTALNVRAGDEAYVDLLREHDRVVEAHIAAFGGVRFKHTGDGHCAWFARASDAVTCAMRIRDGLERTSVIHPEHPLVARIGIAAGEPVDSGDDLFGLTVVRAARICAAATPGRIYVADEIPRLTQGKPFTYRPVGDLDLRGLPEPTAVSELLTT